MTDGKIYITGRKLYADWKDICLSPEEVAGFDFRGDDWLEVSWPDNAPNRLFSAYCTIRRAELDSVQRLGDGTLICSDCLSKQYPDKEQPNSGWELGVCHYHRPVYKKEHYSSSENH